MWSVSGGLVMGRSLVTLIRTDQCGGGRGNQRAEVMQTILRRYSNLPKGMK